MYDAAPDLLRLLAVPVLGWAAWRDVRTRRVPNRTWYPLAALAVVLLAWEFVATWQGWPGGHYDLQLYAIQVIVSVGVIIPLVTAFWVMGSFGGADAKGFYVVALLFPVYPYFDVPVVDVLVPLYATPIEVFSLTILSNTVLVGALYPVGVAVANLLRGKLAWPMLVGKPVAVGDVPEAFGVLLETPDGYTRAGLDLDALRMYLRWRGLSLAALRADPERYRDPCSLPAEPNPPTDGGIADHAPVADLGGPDGDAISEDGGEGDAAGESGVGDDAGEMRVDDESVGEGGDDADGEGDDAPTDLEDPWGAAAFLDDVDRSTYGTTPEQLRDALDVLAAREGTVWVSPGIPFIVPMFGGLLVSLTYGDVLYHLWSTLFGI